MVTWSLLMCFPPKVTADELYQSFSKIRAQSKVTLERFICNDPVKLIEVRGVFLNLLMNLQYVWFTTVAESKPSRETCEELCWAPNPVCTVWDVIEYRLKSGSDRQLFKKYPGLQCHCESDEESFTSVLSVASLTSLSSLLSPPLSRSLSLSWSPDPDGLWPDGASWPDTRAPGFLSCGTHWEKETKLKNKQLEKRKIYFKKKQIEDFVHLICHVGQVPLHGISILPICIVFGLYLADPAEQELYKAASIRMNPGSEGQPLTTSGLTVFQVKESTYWNLRVFEYRCRAARLLHRGEKLTKLKKETWV